MKTSPFIILAMALTGLALICTSLLTTGCNTTQQTAAYKTIYGLETATTGAYDGYTLAVAKGVFPTNDLPAISRAYNTFQASLGVAVIVAENSTNALAPASLVAESDAVINLISVIKRK